jgi:IMP cyclohydrolase
VAIVPRQGCEGDVYKNPYIAYNCLRIVRNAVIAANGSQTDPISEKIALGVPVRDAFATSLLALDYEKDQYNTPRIACAVTRGAEWGVLGVVRDDGLEVRRVALQPGECCFVSTYETNRISETQRGVFNAASAAEGAEFVLRGGVFAEMTHPVTGVCALETQSGFEIAATQA